MERPSAEAMGPLERLRGLCLALPETTERPSHGEPAWFVRGKKAFVTFADHHHDDRVAFWCAAPDGAQDMLTRWASERFFVPPYVGGRGWIGVRLDVPHDWGEIADLVEDAYREVAPKVLVRRLDEERMRDGLGKTGAYARLRGICLALLGAEERPFAGHTAPAFRVNDKIFVGTTQIGRAAMQFKAPPGAQQALVGSDPRRFHVPKYVGSKGWVGLFLDVTNDWDEIAELVEDSYRLIAPKKLVAELDARRT